MEDKWYDTLRSGKCLDEKNLKALCEKVSKVNFIYKGERNFSRRI